MQGSSGCVIKEFRCAKVFVCVVDGRCVREVQLWDKLGAVGLGNKKKVESWRRDKRECGLVRDMPLWLSRCGGYGG